MDAFSQQYLKDTLINQLSICKVTQEIYKLAYCTNGNLIYLNSPEGRGKGNTY